MGSLPVHSTSVGLLAWEVPLPVACTATCAPMQELHDFPELLYTIETMHELPLVCNSLA